MKSVDISEMLSNAEMLKSIIKDTIDIICQKQADRYPNICRLAHRSNDDKERIAENILDLMTSETLKLELDQAIGQVEGEIGSWGE